MIDPRDLNAIIKRSRKIEPPEGTPLRIAVLGTDSIQFFCIALRVLLWEGGVAAEIYEGEYDGIAMDTLDRDSAFYAFKPTVCILIPAARDVKDLPPLLAEPDEIETCAAFTVSWYRALWTRLGEIGCQVLQANFVIPTLSQLGGMEASYAFSQNNFLRRINLALTEERTANAAILDFDGLASEIGKKAWFDYPAFFLGKMGYHPDFTGLAAGLAVDRIRAISGKAGKCLVLDLDNTLWGGVVGDDGWDGINLDPNDAVGESYRFFQAYVLSLKERGVILAVCSKNEEETAKLPFERNKNMLLHLDDISCFAANWDDKASNLKHIAETLSIGTDSLVFFDDNPAEREIVRTWLPEVNVVEVPGDPALYASALHEARAFEWMQITKEDLTRTDSYRTNADRKSLANDFVDYDAYLKALEMRGCAEPVTKNQTERFVQLIGKSNQFNLRTQRYSEAEITALSADPQCRLIAVTLSDKFSDYGLISCIILKKIGEICFIDTWLMSCRVLKRGVEDFALAAVLGAAQELGAERLIGQYIPTSKNAMVKDFYPQMGFDGADAIDYPDLPKDEGAVLYALPVSAAAPGDTYITPVLD